MGLADQISLRSRRRKFGLFMETMAPTAETTVLDVGVDDFAFGELSVNEGSCGTLNFFEEMYPWPERITAVGLHEGDALPRQLPATRATCRATRSSSRSRTARSTSSSRTR